MDSTLCPSQAPRNCIFDSKFQPISQATGVDQHSAVDEHLMLAPHVDVKHTATKDNMHHLSPLNVQCDNGSGGRSGG